MFAHFVLAQCIVKMSLVCFQQAEIGAHLNNIQMHNERSRKFLDFSQSQFSCFAISVHNLSRKWKKPSFFSSIFLRHVFTLSSQRHYLQTLCFVLHLVFFCYPAFWFFSLHYDSTSLFYVDKIFIASFGWSRWFQFSLFFSQREKNRDLFLQWKTLK